MTPTGRLLSITARGGFTQTLSRDEHGQLASVTGPFGRTLVFEYASGRLVTVRDPAGGAIRYGYSGGQLTSVAYPDATPADLDDDPTRQYHYEDPAFPRHLTGISDERGVRFATWTYDDEGRAVSATHAGGADAATLTYNADGTTTVDDALGHRRVLSFELNHGVWRLKASAGGRCPSCSGGVRSSEVDDDGFLSRSVSYNGHVTEYVHDERGLELSRTEAAGTPVERTTLTEWHAEYRVPVRIEEPGNVTTFTYDDAGRLLTRTETDPATGRTRTVGHSYNADGLLVAVDGPRTDVDDITRFEHVDGVVTRISNALGHETLITAHDAHGRPTRIVDPNGLVTELDYDARGRLTMRRVGGLSTRFEYDAAGHLRHHDPRRWQHRSSTPTTMPVAWSQSSMARATVSTMSSTPWATAPREHVRDPNGTLASTPPPGIRHPRPARAQHRRRRPGAPASNTMRWTTSSRCWTARVSVPSTTTTRSSARCEASTPSATPPRLATTRATTSSRSPTHARLTTSYTVDGLDDLLGEESPDRGQRTYLTDEAGNRVAQTDGRGVTAELTYDALNRLTSVRYPNAEQDITYAYDSAPNGIGRLASVTDESGTTSYEYDRRGNVVVERRDIAGETFVTRYAYDDVDRVASMTYPSGREVTYTRDTAGRARRHDPDRRRGDDPRLPPTSATTAPGGLSPGRSATASRSGSATTSPGAPWRWTPPAFSSGSMTMTRTTTCARFRTCW